MPMYGSNRESSGFLHGFTGSEGVRAILWVSVSITGYPACLCRNHAVLDRLDSLSHICLLPCGRSMMDVSLRFHILKTSFLGTLRLKHASIIRCSQTSMSLFVTPTDVRMQRAAVLQIISYLCCLRPYGTIRLLIRSPKSRTPLIYRRIVNNLYFQINKNLNIPNLCQKNSQRVLAKISNLEYTHYMQIRVGRLNLFGNVAEGMFRTGGQSVFAV